MADLKSPQKNRDTHFTTSHISSGPGCAPPLDSERERAGEQAVMATWVAPALMVLAMFHTVRSSSDGYGTAEDHDDNAKVIKLMKSDPESQFGE